MEQTELLMASAFYKSDLQQQRDCLISKTHTTKLMFFNELSFRSNVVSIKCRSINCRNTDNSRLG